MRKLILGLIGVVILAVAAPPVYRWPSGPNPDQVALASERARADDLKRQLDELTERDRRGKPVPLDLKSLAALDDVRAQRDAAVSANTRPRPAPSDPKTEAQIADLRRQNQAKDDALKAPHPDRPDTEALAALADVRAQRDALERQLARPRPEPVSPVVATMTKDQIVHATHLFGLYTEQAPFSMAEVDLVQDEVGRKADAVGYFQSWVDPFRADAIEATWRRGQVPLLTWEPQRQVGIVSNEAPEFSLPTIIGGAHDDYIRSYARGIRDLGLPAVIRLAHEMNGAWYPWSEVEGWSGRSINGNHRGDYARMWRHVHDIFQTEGANDYTIWLWAPNRVNKIPSQPDPAEFYPGDDVVDWVGLSGYYRPDDPEPTFDDTYGQTLPLLRTAAPGKPIFLAEIGATEKGGDKPEWVASLFDGLTRNPDIIGFAWFNHVVTSGTVDNPQTNDWRINSTARSAGAMREALARY